ncbi:MAG: nitrous oxide-stimulated promoter family protein [Proteiniphilum sp.]|nr:nitrous oxide-stimulated promoter family protein [Proteiniphilum sp.]
MNEAEKKVVGKMIAIYCRRRHGSTGRLCDECDALLRYAEQRLERCPFGEEKPTCASCTVHCYKSDMRQKIKEVMRMAGPRMLLLHPVDTLRHFCKERQRARRFVQGATANKEQTGETAEST